jgi:uncharacterized protein YbjT (DUF2867 family)
MARKTIAVVGATGAQGGGLVRAITSDPDGGFAARALTRNPSSDKAKALAALGAEVVAADVDDPASLQRAFQGAHGAFCVTFFWDHFSVEKEKVQAKAMAQAAKAAGIAHAVWSTLDDTRERVPLSDSRMPTLQGQYKVPHFDGKGEADGYFREAFVPTTFLLTSFYWDNLIHFGMGPKPGPDGTLVFTLPMADKKLPGIAAEDIGRCAYGIFQRGGELVGKTVGISGDQLTGAQMAEALSKALGRKVVHHSPSFEEYRKYGFPGADDLGNMFQYKHDFEAAFCGARDVGFSRALNPRLQSFSQWLEANKQLIPTS